MTDVELDARITALEENGGVSPQNGNKTLINNTDHAPNTHPDLTMLAET